MPYYLPPSNDNRGLLTGKRSGHLEGLSRQGENQLGTQSSQQNLSTSRVLPEGESSGVGAAGVVTTPSQRPPYPSSEVAYATSTSHVQDTPASLTAGQTINAASGPPQSSEERNHPEQWRQPLDLTSVSELPPAYHGRASSTNIPPKEEV